MTILDDIPKFGGQSHRTRIEPYLHAFGEYIARAPRLGSLQSIPRREKFLALLQRLGGANGNVPAFRATTFKR
jgi:hypothetical protein